MFTGAALLFAPSWTPPAQPSQPPTWPGGWDQAALAQSFSTMGLTPPVITEWIADSGASFHTTPDAGILSSVRPPHPSCSSFIMVGDGSCLPVTAVGSAPGSFRLPNVLVAPQMIHNLLSIRQFTSDNSCSIEFDSSGLTVKDSASRRPLLRCDVTARGPFTPFAFLLPLLRLRLPLCLLLLPRRRLSPPGTAGLVTPAAMFWLGLVVVLIFLVLGLLLSTFVMRASLVVMFDFLFLLLRMRHMPLILFIVTCGLLLYPAFLVINTIWWWLMISLITLGLFLCAPSLRPSPPFSNSFPGCPLSSASPLRPSSVTTGVSSTTPPPVLSSSLGVFSCVCHVHIPLLRTGKA